MCLYIYVGHVNRVSRQFPSRKNFQVGSVGNLLLPYLVECAVGGHGFEMCVFVLVESVLFGGGGILLSYCIPELGLTLVRVGQNLYYVALHIFSKIVVSVKKIPEKDWPLIVLCFK